MPESFIALQLAAVWQLSVPLCSTFTSLERISGVLLLRKMLLCEGDSNINRDRWEHVVGAMMAVR